MGPLFCERRKRHRRRQGILRFAGGQNYAGILVVLVALWAIAQSLRRQNSVFPETQRRFIWFWAVVLMVSLLLAYGTVRAVLPVFLHAAVFLHDPESDQIHYSCFPGRW